MTLRVSRFAMGDKKCRSPLTQLSLQQGRIPDFIGDGGILISGMNAEIYHISRQLNITLSPRITAAHMMVKNIHRVSLFQNGVMVRLYLVPDDFMALYSELCLRDCLVFVHPVDMCTMYTKTLVFMGLQNGYLQTICEEDAIITTGRLICEADCYLNIMTFQGSHFMAISFRTFNIRNKYRAVVVMRLKLKI